MNSALQPQAQTHAQLTETVSKIEAHLVSLKAELSFLESRLNQTRGTYHQALRYLNEVKAELAMQERASLNEPHLTHELNLDPELDADWDHLIHQISTMCSPL